MEYSAEEIRSFEGQKVKIRFKDGCCMDLRITDTLRIEKYDEFTGDILAVHCENPNHVHHQAGNVCNIRRQNVSHIIMI